MIITTPKWCAESASGLCGNCNGNTTDDAVTSFGENVGAHPHKDDLIVESWWLPVYGEDRAM